MRTELDILVSAGRALGRIDQSGERGLSMLSLDDIEAMALALVLLGLVAIPPGAPAPEYPTVNRQQRTPS